MLAAKRGFVMATFCALSVTGCASPYYTDRGALFGGLTGAGVGALVGEAAGHPGVGALVGAGVGTLSGAAVGSGLDQIEAKNRAMIVAQLGRQVPPGAVTPNEVMTMTAGHVDEDLIVNHIRANGLARPLQPGELIAMQQQGVSKRVIETMQMAVPATPLRLAAPPGPVVMPAGYYPPPWPYYYPPPYPYPPPPAWGVGFMFR